MSDQEGPSTADVPPTSEAAATEAVEPTPEAPSSTPVDGWVQGADGRWWPPAPARQRPRPAAPAAPARSKRGRRLVGGVGFVVFIVIVLAIVGGIVAVLVNYGDDSNSSDTNKGAHAIGETARTASVDASVTAVQNPYTEPNPLTQPGPGFHFLVVQVTMNNVSTKDLVVAPPQQFELTDAAGQKERLISTTSVPSLEGVLVALGARQGGVVFAIPDTARGPFTFRAKGEPRAGGVTFVIP